MPPYTRVPPCSAMPFMIEPMPCSRMPKCSTRPYWSPVKSLVDSSAGMKDGWPLGVVLLDSARSAEPPHSSGSSGAIAVSTSPEALRVATPLASAGNDGSAFSQPAGRLRVRIRSKSSLRWR